MGVFPHPFRQSLGMGCVPFPFPSRGVSLEGLAQFLGWAFPPEIVCDMGESMFCGFLWEERGGSSSSVLLSGSAHALLLHSRVGDSRFRAHTPPAR